MMTIDEIIENHMSAKEQAKGSMSRATCKWIAIQYAKQACEKQKEICTNQVVLSSDKYYVKNAPLPELK